MRSCKLLKIVCFHQLAQIDNSVDCVSSCSGSLLNQLGPVWLMYSELLMYGMWPVCIQSIKVTCFWNWLISFYQARACCSLKKGERVVEKVCRVHGSSNVFQQLDLPWSHWHQWGGSVSASLRREPYIDISPTMLVSCMVVLTGKQTSLCHGSNVILLC